MSRENLQNIRAIPYPNPPSIKYRGLKRT